MVSRRSAVAAGLTVAVGAVTAACGSKSGNRWAQPGSVPVGATTVASPTSKVDLNITPAANATEVAPTAEVVVQAQGGTLQNVAVSAGGKTVQGALDAEKRSWRSSGQLEYGQTYTVTTSAVDDAGLATERTSTFTTIKPKSTATVTFQANSLVAMKNGGTYGVGQVVAVHFSKPVKDRPAAEKAMTVTPSPAVEGRWRWMDSQTAHWRPAEYWASGTKVAVKVDTFGVDLGEGVFGSASASLNFTIGAARIAVADSNTHHMIVKLDGKQIRDIPISMGKGGTSGKANYWTRSGVHVVMNKAPSVTMSSESSGITDPKDPNYYKEEVKLCCQLTYSGEYVHLADWNVAQHGVSNTSHGCINVGPAHAQWCYDNFQIGDVVEVKNTPRQMALSDGTGGDWCVAWSQW